MNSQIIYEWIDADYHIKGDVLCNVNFKINKNQNKIFKFFTVSKKKKQYEYVIITVNISFLKKTISG